MHAAIDDIHHRHWQHARGRAADIAIQWRLVGRGRSFRNGERHAENCIGPKPAFVRGSVEGDQRLVDLGLRFGIHAANGVEDLAIDRIDCLAARPFPLIALLVAVAQFDRLVCAG